MSEPFLGDIKLFGFNFAPRGFALCDGQLLPIAQHQSLFSLLGTSYGGDGVTTFALPDLRGRVPIHPGTASSGQSYQVGAKGGEERHVLSGGEMPRHDHQAHATDQAAAGASPAGQRLATTSGRRAVNPYGAANTLTALHNDSLGLIGSGQGHENMQPFQAINFCIALEGLYPSRS